MKCIFDLQNTKNNYNVQFLHKNTVKNGKYKNNLKHLSTHYASTVNISQSLWFILVNVSLFFTEKGRLLHNILPLKRNEFIPKRYDFSCGNWGLLPFLRF